jgi:hypothetical protein
MLCFTTFCSRDIFLLRSFCLGTLCRCTYKRYVEEMQMDAGHKEGGGDKRVNGENERLPGGHCMMVDKKEDRRRRSD